MKTYQHSIRCIRISIRKWSVNGKRNTVGEDRAQNQPLEWSTHTDWEPRRELNFLFYSKHDYSLILFQDSKGKRKGNSRKS